MIEINISLIQFLCFRFHVADRLAFPLLLRGLEETSKWTTLNRVELGDEISPDLTNPLVGFNFQIV